MVADDPAATLCRGSIELECDDALQRPGLLRLHVRAALGRSQFPSISGSILDISGCGARSRVVLCPDHRSHRSTTLSSGTVWARLVCVWSRNHGLSAGAIEFVRVSAVGGS